MPTIYRQFDAAADSTAGANWEQTIEEVFGGVEMNIADKSAFSGEIRGSTLGGIEISTVGSRYEDAVRTARHVARDHMAYFVLSFVRRGKLHLEQSGRGCDVEAGEFVLFDLNSPYRYRHIEWADVLNLKMPAAMLEARAAGPHNCVGRVGSARSGIGRVAMDALASFAAEADDISDDIADSCAAKMVDLVAVLLAADGHGVPTGDSSVRAALYRRIVGLIDANFSDPDLDAEKIAGVIGISVRYLHRIFQGTGESVGEALRKRRLARCHDEISSAANRHLPVKEIAFRSGFRSQSHFATAFRRRYRISPTGLRRSLRN